MGRKHAPVNYSLQVSLGSMKRFIQHDSESTMIMSSVLGPEESRASIQVSRARGTCGA